MSARLNCSCCGTASWSTSRVAARAVDIWQEAFGAGKRLTHTRRATLLSGTPALGRSPPPPPQNPLCEDHGSRARWTSGEQARVCVQENVSHDCAEPKSRRYAGLLHQVACGAQRAAAASGSSGAVEYGLLCSQGNGSLLLQVLRGPQEPKSKAPSTAGSSAASAGARPARPSPRGLLCAPARVAA